jgi:BirA family biotin operon repressor/biotin-[acetyl-CoA-carboxylase] ligase
MNFKFVHIAETDSTNRWLKEHGDSEDMVVWTDYQTAGRGCGTNTWESERSKNLLLSVLVHPTNVSAQEQFILSMANALALRDMLEKYTDGISIKWPNDIYWKDSKICGTLIETTLAGSRIKDCIIGTGINVNQQTFHSDAPNPISLAQILGHETDLKQILQEVVNHTASYMDRVNSGEWEEIRAEYRQSLYRKGEWHTYHIVGEGTVRGQLTDITNDGHLLLQMEGTTTLRSFAFKEVQFII